MPSSSAKGRNTIPVSVLSTPFRYQWTTPKPDAGHGRVVDITPTRRENPLRQSTKRSDSPGNRPTTPPSPTGTIDSVVEMEFIAWATFHLGKFPEISATGAVSREDRSICADTNWVRRRMAAARRHSGGATIWPTPGLFALRFHSGPQLTSAATIGRASAINRSFAALRPKTRRERRIRARAPKRRGARGVARRPRQPARCLAFGRVLRRRARMSAEGPRCRYGSKTRAGANHVPRGQGQCGRHRNYPQK